MARWTLFKDVKPFIGAVYNASVSMVYHASVSVYDRAAKNGDWMSQEPRV